MGEAEKAVISTDYKLPNRHLLPEIGSPGPRGPDDDALSLLPFFNLLSFPLLVLVQTSNKITGPPVGRICRQRNRQRRHILYQKGDQDGLTDILYRHGIGP